MGTAGSRPSGPQPAQHGAPRAGEGERSILVLDDRDRRVQSPFQGWLLDEVLTNALAGINAVRTGMQ